MPTIMRLLALCLPLALASPLAAQDRSTRFLQLLRFLPDSIIANRSPAIPGFADLAAARAIGDLGGRAGAVEPGARRLVYGGLSDAPESEDWTGTVGFAREEVLAAVDNGVPEDRGMVLLIDAAAVPRIGPALLANGYVYDEERGFPAYWRIEQDHSVDIALRAADDPFTYPLPKSSRIALDGDVLLQASSWPALQAMFATSDVSPVLEAFGRALDLPDWGDRQLVQAMLFSDPMAFAPALKIDGDLDIVDIPPGGVPYWNNLMLADLAGPEGDLSLIVMIYVAKTDADAAAAALTAGLGQLVLSSFGQKTLDELTGPGKVTVTGEGPYAVVYAVETAPDVKTPRLVQNRGYHVLRTAALTRKLLLLGPGLP